MRLKNFILSKKIFIFLLIFCFSLPTFAQTKRNQITLFGGLNHIFEYGSEEDYVLGENDFPVTPSHTPPIFGLSYSIFFFKNLGFEVDFRYNLSSELTLRDPSDNDTVKIKSNKHYTFTGNLIFQLSSGKIRPYLFLGAGIDTLLDVKDETLTSEFGYLVFFEAPEKKSDFVANAGFGIFYSLISNFGTRIDARYIFIPKTAEHPSINSFNFAIGIFYRF